MELIVHDLKEGMLNQIYEPEEDSRTVSKAMGEPRPCLGCFGCWIQTPGTCVVQDGYQDMGAFLAGCDTFVIISRCEYGIYSAYVKDVLDRSISYILPYFTVRNGEVHHARRYEKRLKVKVIFYGTDISQREVEIAEQLISANCVNWDADLIDLTFKEDLWQ